MWVRFPNLVSFVLGKTPERHNNKYWEFGKYPWFSIADMKDKAIIYNSKEKISEQSYQEYFSQKLSPAGTLLMSFKLTVGRVSILGVDAVHNEAIISIFPYFDNDNSIRDWLFYTLGILVDYVDQTDAIKGSTLNKEKISKMLIPIPPLAEQKRIIDKLNSFEPILTYYNELEIELSKIENNFSEKLKKSILQYAIEGKLVKHDVNDEPASVLLEKIKEEKSKLVKAVKIKREISENSLIPNDDKNYYENLPSKWELIPLQSICQVYGGKRIPAGEKFSSSRTNYKYLRVTDMKNSSIVSCAYISKEIYNLIKKYTITKDDIYITVAGTIGVVGEIPSEFDGANLTENADKLVLSKYINKNWFIKFLQSNFSQKQIKESITKVGQPKLAIKRIENIIVCLPPYNEQIRITNFINKILMIID